MRWAAITAALLLYAAQASRSLAQSCSEGAGSQRAACCATGQMWDQRFARCVPDARAACIAGDYNACVTAGDHFLGSGRAPDRSQAHVYYRQACEHGAAAGCTALGTLELSESSPQAQRRAETWFGRGCDGAHLRGCTALAELYLGYPEQQQHDQALSFLQRACDGLEPRACARLALLAAPRDAARSCELAKRAKSVSDPLGQLAWAKLEAEGRCGKTDREQVYLAFEAACRGGEGEGCFELARRQVSGEAPQRALDRVRGWLQTACAQQHTAACVQLADDFEQGKTGPQDPALMRAALTDACKLRSAPACARLAIAVDAATPRETTTATWAWEAACKGDVNFCFGLAEQLLDHPQPQNDLRRAEQLLQADCDRQHAAGCATLADVHGWRGARLPTQQAAQEFSQAQDLLTTACELHDADSCVKAALLLLNGNPEGLARARSLLETACKAGSQLGCAYLKQGPYPFPYPARGAVAARFAGYPQAAPDATERRPPSAAAQAAHAHRITRRLPAAQARVASTTGHAARASLQAEFSIAGTREAKLGSMVWAAQTGFGHGFGFAARLPLYAATLRGLDGSPNAYGLGNPHFRLSHDTLRDTQRLSFELGFTLPIAYVSARALGDMIDDRSLISDATLRGLEAAADANGLADAYLWTADTAGLVAGAAYETWQGPWIIATDAQVATLVGFYARSNIEVFGALRARIGLRAWHVWTFSLGVAARGLADEELARLALEPEVAYAANGGGRLTLGLSAVVWNGDASVLGPAPWLGIKVRIEP